MNGAAVSGLDQAGAGRLPRGLRDPTGRTEVSTGGAGGEHLGTARDEGHPQGSCPPRVFNYQSLLGQSDWSDGHPGLWYAAGKTGALRTHLLLHCVLHGEDDHPVPRDVLQRVPED